MRLISCNITVAAAAVFIVHTVSALPAFPSTSLKSISPSAAPMLTSIVAIVPETRNLSDYLPSINTSFPSNLTDGNDILLIEQCGGDEQTVQRASNLAKAAVNVARWDAALGTDSPHGFTAMFKADVSKHQVLLYLNDIYESEGLTGLKPDSAQATSPRLACVRPDSATVYRDLKLTYDPWKRCQNRQTRHPSSLNAFYTVGTAYIFLCPDFLNQALAPLGNHCPTVVDNVFTGNVDVFYRNYQMYQLLYQLIRFYLQRNTLAPENFGWNRCVGINIESSVRNPTNFLLHIACKSNLFFRCLITSFSIWT